VSNTNLFGANETSILETKRMTHALMFAAIAALGQVPELNDQSLERWRDYVRPQAKEESYLEIPWRESFYIAINEARETNRPVLLWTMNGHPLGCT
jgi:hypothetical protein